MRLRVSLHFLNVVKALSALPAFGVVLVTEAGAQPNAPQGPPSKTADIPYDNPMEAFENGAFAQALSGFVDLQVERPDDPEVSFNIGATHYQMRNYEEARKSFEASLITNDPALRAQSLYNLGNVAFREGKLQDAVELYQRTLELNPDDKDAKHNLEYVRDEIRRRLEEAKKRQEQQPQPETPPPDASQSESPTQENPSDTRDSTSKEDASTSPADEDEDEDEDGLPDALEESAENPTDPMKADSDGDGLADGEEDRNHNGRVDPGETDPNQTDSDGDGTPDGAVGGAPGDAVPDDDQPLSEEAVERYLRSLQERRPERRQPSRRGPHGAYRSPKDW